MTLFLAVNINPSMTVSIRREYSHSHRERERGQGAHLRAAAHAPDGAMGEGIAIGETNPGARRLRYLRSQKSDPRLLTTSSELAARLLV